MALSCCFRMELSLNFKELVGENGGHPLCPPWQRLLWLPGLSFLLKAVLGCACSFLFGLGPAHSGDLETRPYPIEASCLELNAQSCPPSTPGQCPAPRGRQVSLSGASVWLCQFQRGFVLHGSPFQFSLRGSDGPAVPEGPPSWPGLGFDMVRGHCSL